MAYVDGLVCAVPTDKKEEYLAHVAVVGELLIECGALAVFEGWGEDVPDGEVTSFPKAVECKEDETVVFSWIRWPSREVRDKGMELLMADPRAKEEMARMPFDGKRLIFGGFEELYTR